MAERCRASFDESLLSAALDGELTQAESQRVRLHLEECAPCRNLLEEMRKMRKATLSTEFPVPNDRQWDERPRGGLSRVLRRVGWALVVVWLAGISVLAVWSFFDAPAEWWEKVLVVSLVGGPLLLLLSVLLDRLRALGIDRYRRVEK